MLAMMPQLVQTNIHTQKPFATFLMADAQFAAKNFCRARQKKRLSTSRRRSKASSITLS